MWKCFIAAVLLMAAGCARTMREVAPPLVQAAKTGRCGEKLGASPFKKPRALHFLVADFYGVTSADCEPNFSEAVSTQVTRALEAFKEEVLRNPEELDIEVPEGSLEIERLSCFLENHEQAEAAARELDADVVLWGQASCDAVSPVVVNNQSTTSVGNVSAERHSVIHLGNKEIQAGKPYTVSPKATLYHSERSYRRGSELGVELASLGHLDLPTLRSTEPFVLVQFALGLHFHEMGHDRLAARFFEKSAEKVLSEEDWQALAIIEKALGMDHPTTRAIRSKLEAVTKPPAAPADEGAPVSASANESKPTAGSASTMKTKIGNVNVGDGTTVKIGNVQGAGSAETEVGDVTCGKNCVIEAGNKVK